MPRIELVLDLVQGLLFPEKSLLFAKWKNSVLWPHLQRNCRLENFLRIFFFFGKRELKVFKMPQLRAFRLNQLIVIKIWGILLEKYKNAPLRNYCSYSLISSSFIFFFFLIFLSLFFYKSPKFCWRQIDFTEKPLIAIF